jgi:hypothetical protein
MFYIKYDSNTYTRHQKHNKIMKTIIIVYEYSCSNLKVQLLKLDI